MVGFLHSGINCIERTRPASRWWGQMVGSDGGVRWWVQMAEEASFMWVDGSHVSDWHHSYTVSLLKYLTLLISLATTNTNIIFKFFCWLLKRMYLPILRSLFSRLLTFAICCTSIWLAGACGQLAPVNWVTSEISARHCQLCPTKTKQKRLVVDR